MTDEPNPEFDAELPATTVPANYQIAISGFDTEERAVEFGNSLGDAIRELSRYFDLSRLDGVTVSSDYRQALISLDRGYTSSHVLTPSDDYAVGVAMTPSVMRNGNIKSHMVFNVECLRHLENTKNEYFGWAFHLLAHECAHVEVTHRFDSVFPNFLLRAVHTNLHDSLRWQVILACWDEYAVTSRCARFGEPATEGYEETFLQSLERTRHHADELIDAYYSHGDVNQVLTGVYGGYGNLMKFSAYHLGNLAGLGLGIKDLPRTAEALDNHWFSPYFDRLKDVLETINRNYGAWLDQSAFEAIGDLADDIVAAGGMYLTPMPDGRLHVGF